MDGAGIYVCKKAELKGSDLLNLGSRMKSKMTPRVESELVREWRGHLLR